jgi:hypothetical protein
VVQVNELGRIRSECLLVRGSKAALSRGDNCCDYLGLDRCVQ